MKSPYRIPMTKTKGEVLRDKVLKVYPEWSVWPRDLRRIFILLPSYGADWDGIENICRDLEWDFASVRKRVVANKSFSAALEEYASSGHQYRKANVEVVNKKRWNLVVKWSMLQQVYMMESGIVSFVKGEVSKVSASEAKLVEKSRLLDIEPVVHVPGDQPESSENGNYNTDSGGEASLHALARNLGA